MTTLELDADSIIYKTGFAIDAAEADDTIIMPILTKTLNAIQIDSACHKVNIYIGTDTNYRKEIATIATYKGNRKDMKKPKYYHEIRSALINDFGAILVRGQEAEDAVGIAAMQYKDYDDYVIGAIDKDMLMIPGRHYNYGNGKTYFISTREAIINFYVQLISGDRTDNIPGVYKLLKNRKMASEAKKFQYSSYIAKAKKALSECETELDMFKYVESVYDKELKLDKKLATSILEIARLLWIRREENEMWVPPTLRDFHYLKPKRNQNLGK